MHHGWGRVGALGLISRSRSIRHAVLPPSPPCHPQNMLRLFNICLIVVSVAVARELLVFSTYLLVCLSFPRLHLVLVHAVTVLLCFVSLSAYQPKPSVLLIVCFVLAIVVLVCRFRCLVDCCVGAFRHRDLRCLGCTPSSLGEVSGSKHKPQQHQTDPTLYADAQRALDDR